MEQQNVYDRIRNRTKPETRQYVQKNLAVVAEVDRLMKLKGWSQKDLAKKLGKTNSEVSKWLSGLHNLTLKSIAKMEVVLEANLLEVPKPAEARGGTAKGMTIPMKKPLESHLFDKIKIEKTAKFHYYSESTKSMVA